MPTFPSPTTSVNSRALRFTVSALLVLACGGAAFAAPPLTPSRVLIFWTPVAFVPPGTNDVRVVDTPAIAPVDSGSQSAPGSIATPPSAAGTGAMPSGIDRIPRTTPSPAGMPGSSPGQGGGIGQRAANVPNTTPSSPVELPAGCKVRFSKMMDTVAAFGGVVELQLTFTPAKCRTAPAVSAGWLQPVAGTGKEGYYKFSVPPNPTAEPRTVAVALGDQKFVVRQEPGRRVHIAAAPSRLVFGINGASPPNSRILTIWSEEKDLIYAVSPSAEKWLRMKPLAAKGPADQRRFQIEVNPVGLAPGRHEARIQIYATGVVNGPLVIPVVVEAPGK